MKILATYEFKDHLVHLMDDNSKWKSDLNGNNFEKILLSTQEFNVNFNEEQRLTLEKRQAEGEEAERSYKEDA